MAINYALASNGTTVTGNPASTSFPASAVIDGNRTTGGNWASGGGYSTDFSGTGLPDYLVIDFNASRTIDELDVFTLRDAYNDTSVPTLTETFTQYGVTSFDIEKWTGSAWVSVFNTPITGNNKVWRQFKASNGDFTQFTTTKIRFKGISSGDGDIRIVELEAWSYPVVALKTVRLTWTASVDNESGIIGYFIDRSTDSLFGSDVTTIPIMGSTTLQYDDPGRSVDVPLYYRIKAKNGVGLYSNYATTTITPTASGGGSSTGFVSTDINGFRQTDSNGFLITE